MVYILKSYFKVPKISIIVYLNALRKRYIAKRVEKRFCFFNLLITLADTIMKTSTNFTYFNWFYFFFNERNETLYV